jgi:putative component of toxin-antitoxin plasmid stabilization module
MRRLPVELRIFQDAIGRCLILCGGSKRIQLADIERARKWLEEATRQSSR